MSNIDDLLLRMQYLTPPRQYAARVLKATEMIPDRIGAKRLAIPKAFCMEYQEYDNSRGFVKAQHMWYKHMVGNGQEDMLLKLEHFCERIRQGEIFTWEEIKAA